MAAKALWKKRVAWYTICLALFFIVVDTIVVLASFNEKYIEFSVADAETVYVEYGDSYDDSDVVAYLKGTIFNKKGKEISVSVDGTVNETEFGEYDLTYTAADGEAIGQLTRKVIVEDTLAPVISLVEEEDYYTSPNEEYVEEGYTAVDNYDGDITDQVVREEKDGIVTYTVSDSFGNTSTVTREIVYADSAAPEIKLLGDYEIILETGSEYTEPGYTATDDCDGDITDEVSVEGSVDVDTPGNYEIKYTVEDSDHNTSMVKRTVVVQDLEGPEIVLNGDKKVYVALGNKYEDEGATAVDACDGDVSDSLSVEGKVDTDTCGVYTVTYSASDASGNETTATRMVYVYQKQPDVETVIPEGKVVYLTFDDGPGKYTEKLLDILDEYNVKVTFFVTNQYSEYQDLIAEEYKRGHTVAIHSYSHVYSTIYASEEAFYQDIENMNSIIFEQTGVRATIIRFPGGSSNTISKNYCEGIMTALTESLGKMGYQYCDWNVASGDAGDTTSTSQIASNVIAGIQKQEVSVVLQHDVHDYSVDAVEEIIMWGLANGYTFLALDDSSPMVHHSVGN